MVLLFQELPFPCDIESAHVSHRLVYTWPFAVLPAAHPIEQALSSKDGLQQVLVVKSATRIEMNHGHQTHRWSH
jgi:hypothetical protein